MRTPELIKSDIETVEKAIELLLCDISKYEGELQRIQKRLESLDKTHVQLKFDLTKYNKDLNEVVPPYGAPVRCWNNERPKYPRLMYSKGELNNNGLNVFRSNLYCEEEESTFFKHWEV